MACPYLTEVTMVFCRAFPVKKLLASDRLSTAGLCCSDCFCTCSVFRDADARARTPFAEAEEKTHEPNVAGGKP